MAPTESISGGLLLALTEVLRKLHARSPFGVLVVHSAAAAWEEQIANAAKEAGAKYQTITGGAWGEAAESANGGLTSADVLVETSDVLVLVLTASSDDEDPAGHDLVSYAQGIGRPVIRIDGVTGTLQDDIPERIEREQGWLPELFETAGLSPDADLETVKSKMSAVANQTAPLTRRGWKWILLLQGLAVLAPLAWLVRRPVDLPVRETALLTLCAVILLVALNWWLRWRGMQKTWARSRLVAEHARSLLATVDCPHMPALQSLALVPALRPLRWIAHRPAGSVSFAEWRDFYVQKRIGDQEEYFSEKQKQAESQRKRLTRWATLLLDIALAFAFAGAIVAFAPHYRDWIRKLGDIRLEIVLGVAGALMPLGLLLVQILRGVQELNRRTARFAQQSQMLEQAKARLESVASPKPAMEVIENTERQLLAEVLEWYFHAETAEHFFHIRNIRDHSPKPRALGMDKRSPAHGFSMMVLAKTGIAGLFLLRVILGRVPWIVGSGAAALIWVMYHEPSDLKSRNQLKVLAELKDNLGETWDPSEEKAERGCVILVHGLHGHSIFTKLEKKDDWMQQSADAIVQRLGGKDQAPNICLVDWEGVATPSDIYDVVLNTKQGRLVQDVVDIRNQAREVGNELAFRLAQLVLEEKKIRRDRPFHLIGHSAGGFVVARVVKVLSQLHSVPTSLHVTILDTPAPDEEVLVELPEKCPTDFYISSPVGGRNALLQLADFSAPGMHMAQRSPPSNIEDLVDKHRWAYDWFIQTIKDPGSDPQEGFNKSPLVKAMSPNSTH